MLLRVFWGIEQWILQTVNIFNESKKKKSQMSILPQIQKWELQHIQMLTEKTRQFSNLGRL